MVSIAMFSYDWFYVSFVCCVWFSVANCAVVLGSENNTSHARQNNEIFSQCSSFHYEEHVLKKLVEMEHQIGLFRDVIKTYESEMTDWRKGVEDKFELERKRFENVLTGYMEFVDKRNPTTAFSVYISTSLTISNHNILKFDKIWTNIGNAYDKFSGIFRAKYAGLYHFSVVLLSAEGQDYYFHIWLNEEAKHGSYAYGKGYNSGTIDIVLDLKVDDRVYVKSKHSTARIYSNTDHFTTFSGYLI